MHIRRKSPLRSALIVSAAIAALAGCTTAGETGTSTVVSTPEGALMDVSTDLAYKSGELTQEQLTSSTRSLIQGTSANIFRRFPRGMTEQMVTFYTEALSLRSLNPIQLTSTQTMILTGVGSGQIKLSAGQQGNRSYNLEGGHSGGTGIRFLVLTYPDANVVQQRFADAGLAKPTFTQRDDGYQQAMVNDPAGLGIVILARADAKDHSDDGVGVGINVSNLEESRAFYRDFVGLDEGRPIDAPLLGTTLYPYTHGETQILLYKIGDNLPADTGSSGIQYVVNDAAMVDAKGKNRKVTVETPLNKLRGFELTTIWLNDPNGVTNYFAQVGATDRDGNAVRTGD